MIGYRRGYTLQSIEELTLPTVETFTKVSMTPGIGDGNTSVFTFGPIPLCDRYGRTETGDGMRSTSLRYGTDCTVYINDVLVDPDRIRLDMFNSTVTFNTILYRKTGVHTSPNIDIPKPLPPTITVVGQHGFTPDTIPDVNYLNDPTTIFDDGKMQLDAVTSILTNVTTGTKGTMVDVQDHKITTDNPNLLWNDGDQYVFQMVDKTKPVEISGTAKKQQSNELVSSLITFLSGVKIGQHIKNNTTGKEGTIVSIGANYGSLTAEENDGTDILWHDQDDFTITGSFNVTDSRVVNGQSDPALKAAAHHSTYASIDQVGDQYYYYTDIFYSTQLPSFQSILVKAGMRVTATGYGGRTVSAIITSVEGNTLRVNDLGKGTPLLTPPYGTRSDEYLGSRAYDKAFGKGVGTPRTLTLSINDTFNVNITGKANGPKDTDLLFDSDKNFIDLGVKPKSTTDPQLRMEIENLETGETGIIVEVYQLSLKAVKKGASHTPLIFTEGDGYVIHVGFQNIYEDVTGHHIAPSEDVEVYQNFLQDITQDFVSSKVREGMLIKNLTTNKIHIIRHPIERYRLNTTDQDTKNISEWTSGDSYLIDGTFEEKDPYEDEEDGYGTEVEYLYDKTTIFTEESGITNGTAITNISSGVQGTVIGSRIDVHKIFALDKNGQFIKWRDQDSYFIEGLTNTNAPKVGQNVTCNYYARKHIALDYYYDTELTLVSNPSLYSTSVIPTRKFGKAFS